MVTFLLSIFVVMGIISIMIVIAFFINDKYDIWFWIVFVISIIFLSSVLKAWIEIHQDEENILKQNEHYEKCKFTFASYEEQKICIKTLTLLK